MGSSLGCVSIRGAGSGPFTADHGRCGTSKSSIKFWAVRGAAGVLSNAVRASSTGSGPSPSKNLVIAIYDVLNRRGTKGSAGLAYLKIPFRAP